MEAIIFHFKGEEMGTERFSYMSKVEQPVTGSIFALTSKPTFLTRVVPGTSKTVKETST